MAAAHRHRGGRRRGRWRWSRCGCAATIWRSSRSASPSRCASSPATRSGSPTAPTASPASRGRGGAARRRNRSISSISASSPRMVAVASSCSQRLRHSPFGRVLRAIREDEQVAAVAGKQSCCFKVKAFALSAAVARPRRRALGHYTSYIAPDIFVPLHHPLHRAGPAGGRHRQQLAARWLGAFLVVFFMEWTRFATGWLPGLKPVQVAAVREFLISACLLIVLRVRPAGLLPERHPALQVPREQAADGRPPPPPGRRRGRRHHAGPAPGAVRRARRRARRRPRPSPLHAHALPRGSGESERIYTTHPREYPVGGRKALNVTTWAEQVLTAAAALPGPDARRHPRACSSTTR